MSANPEEGGRMSANPDSSSSNDPTRQTRTSRSTGRPSRRDRRPASSRRGTTTAAAPARYVDARVCVHTLTQTHSERGREKGGGERESFRPSARAASAAQSHTPGPCDQNTWPS